MSKQHDKEFKENAKLKKELRDKKETLAILHQRRAEPKKPYVF